MATPTVNLDMGLQSHAELLQFVKMDDMFTLHLRSELLRMLHPLGFPASYALQEEITTKALW